MSSMKSFKSRISQKRGTSQSRVNVSGASQSMIAEYNPKNLYIFPNQVEFTLQRNNDQIVIPPCRLNINNNTGARIFLHIESSKQDFFNTTPKKYILESGNNVQISIKLIQISYVKMQDYEATNFQITWGKISQEQIANKIIPRLTDARVLRCQITNKEIVNQILAKKTYKNSQSLGLDVLQNGRSNKILQNSKILIHDSRREVDIRSGLDASDLKIYEERPSLLRPNIIIAVAVVSFIIGFIGA